MIEHLAALINTFPGAANQMRCFAHILNLVAKSVLRQSEAPKAKGGKVPDNAAKELAAVFDDLEDDTDASDGIRDNAGKEPDSRGNDDGSEEEDDCVVDDNEDGLPDEWDGMEEEELANHEVTVKPIRVMLTKVSSFNLKLCFIWPTAGLKSFEAFHWPWKMLDGDMTSHPNMVRIPELLT